MRIIKKQQGVTLLEVLISMIILMFGLLGIAGTQMLAINNTENARYQGVATTLASSISSVMRGNYAFWSAPKTVTFTGVAAGTTSQTTISTGFGSVPSAVDCASSVCTAPQMAAYDLRTLGLDVANRLPSGTTTIACGTDVPTTCTVTISWLEDNIALTNSAGTETGDLRSGANGTHTFQTLVTVVI